MPPSSSSNGSRCGSSALMSWAMSRNSARSCGHSSGCMVRCRVQRCPPGGSLPRIEARMTTSGAPCSRARSPSISARAPSHGVCKLSRTRSPGAWPSAATASSNLAAVGSSPSALTMAIAKVCASITVSSSTNQRRLPKHSMTAGSFAACRVSVVFPMPGPPRVKTAVEFSLGCQCLDDRGEVFVAAEAPWGFDG